VVCAVVDEPDVVQVGMRGVSDAPGVPKEEDIAMVLLVLVDVLLTTWLAALTMFKEEGGGR
jgi:hypothetical protein